jgi:dihydroorotate dehydrogenase
MYKIVRSFLFLFDPERVHYFSMNVLKLICKSSFIKKRIQKTFSSPALNPTCVFNLQFSNPVGLGAGFDKNALYLNELESLGFGFVEIGTVTPQPQSGNEKPRLFRLPKDKALINRMGFNNEGASTIAERLAAWRGKDGQKTSLIVGGNIGKNKNTPNEEAWKDYEICFNALHEYVDYFVVNVSSPNTPGLRALQEKDSLQQIFSVLHSSNQTKKQPKPILLKIAPDLTREQTDEIISLAIESKLDGLIVSNTTISRENLLQSKEKIKKMGAGGLSGMPLKKRSTELIEYIHKKSEGKIKIIGSGGIFCGKDAEEKLRAGATLIQVWTGFVYEGPSIVKKINKYLVNNK